MVTPEKLVARADQIDNRLGPIPGRDADRIALELRWAAEDITQLRAALQGLVEALAANDEDGLTEFADVMCAARAALRRGEQQQCHESGRAWSEWVQELTDEVLLATIKSTNQAGRYGLAREAAMNEWDKRHPVGAV